MEKWAFLWITDLHYESPNPHLDDGKELSEAYQKAFRESYFQHFHARLQNLRAYAETTPLDLSFIAIGGDITTHGKPQGFATFSQEAFPDLTALVSDTRAICMVPGNHDVTWGINPTASRYFNTKFSAFSAMVSENDVSTCLIPKGELQAGHLDREDQLQFNVVGSGPIYRDDRKGVLVVNINSSIRCAELNLKLCQDLAPFLPDASKAATLTMAASAATSSIRLEDFDHRLQPYLVRDVAHVTQVQLDKLSNRLHTIKADLGQNWDRYLKVALMHHHLIPFPGQYAEHKAYEATVDSSSVLEFLTANDFDMVLTGHKHQPYQTAHRFGDKEILILGGPTVGGPASGKESFHGFHLVEVLAGRHGRSVSIRDIPCDSGTWDAESEFADTARKLPWNLTNRLTLMARAAKRAGFRYRDVVSTTRITTDGDARRVVECDDLIVTRKSARTSHRIELPPTSGHLALFRARDKKGLVYVQKGIQDNDSVKSATVELGFRSEPRVSNGHPETAISYQYEWYAVNAFALDKLQFSRKYGANAFDVEFTHLIPVDPMERLTVIVQFPRNLKLSSIPALRIMRVNPKDANSRTWTIDEEETNHLEDARALRFFESLNIAALRVRAPHPDLSYGIQWTLPDAPAQRSTAKFNALKDGLDSAKEDTLKRVYRILCYSRDPLLSMWEKDLDGTLMIFNMTQRSGLLKIVAAGFVSDPLGEMQALSRDVELEYGEGIAGRAFKSNRIRIYVDPTSEIPAQAPKEDESRFEPNFYKFVEGTLNHKILISFPVHLPVSDDEFDANPTIYESREPYGVLNIGSVLEDCPVGQLLLPARERELLQFQHHVNKTLAQGHLNTR